MVISDEDVISKYSFNEIVDEHYELILFEKEFYIEDDFSIEKFWDSEEKQMALRDEQLLMLDNLKGQE